MQSSSMSKQMSSTRRLEVMKAVDVLLYGCGWFSVG